MGDSVTRAGDGLVRGEQDELLAALELPASDIDKWFVTVVGSRSCAACVKLKQAWETDPWLLAFANPNDAKKSWSHFTYYTIEDESQSWRFAKLQFKAYPTILVQPPRSGKFGDPSLVVFMQVYGGSSEKLAKDITAAIRRYLSRRVEQPPVQMNSQGVQAVEQGAWPRVPDADAGRDRTPPFTPPSVNPPVSPTPAPAPQPIIPILPGEIPPKPKVEPNPEPHKRPVLRKDEIIVVRDGQYGPEIEEQIRTAVASLREEHGGRISVRSVEWQDVKDTLPVTEEDLPALLVVDRGLVGAKISAKLLPLVTPRGGLLLTIWLWLRDVFVWTINFAILACVVLIALATWGFVRRFRKSEGQAVQFNGPVAYTADQVAQILASQRRQEAATPAPAAAPSSPTTVA
jgi:hypothetical protein